MAKSIKSIEKLSEDQASMMKSQMQLFENINLVIDNLKYKTEHQSLVVKNQNLIIKNQEIIVDNQINIINNQRHIVDNQTQLLLINKVLTHLLNEMRKSHGRDESLHQTSDFVNGLLNMIRNDQKGEHFKNSIPIK